MQSRAKGRGTISATAIGSLSLSFAVGAIAACLPDLQEVSSDEAAGSAIHGCGDGVIEALEDGGDGGESCDPGLGMFPECVKCQIRCAGEIDEAGDHCYFRTTPTTTYAAAREACTAARAHLVTFAGASEVSIADRLAEGAAYWVGLSRTPQLDGYESARPEEPGWPRPSSGAACPGCFAVGANESGGFPVEPNADLGDGACLVSRGGAWFRASCTGGAEPRATICEREPAGRRAQYCGGPYCATLPVTAGRKRYILGLSTVSAADAEALCANFEGGSLVLLDSPEEREQLVHELSELLPPPLTVWIGLGLDDFGEWRWDDGVSLVGRPAPWGNAQPLGPGERRAFLRIQAATYDTQLAYSLDPSDPSPAFRYYVCQRR